MDNITETGSAIKPEAEKAEGKKKRMGKKDKRESPQFKKKKKIKVKTIIILVLVVLLLGAGGYGVYRLFFYEEPVEIVTGTTVVDSITTVIEGSAVTSPTSFQMLTIPVDGTVDEVYVEQGDSVEVGDALYTIDGDSIEEDIAELEATIADYEDELADLYDSIDNLTVSAPFTGKLLDVTVDDGDEVGASTTIATLVDDSQMLVDLYFSIAYKDYITTGMSAEVSIPTYMTTLTGTVTEIKDVSYLTAEGAECFGVTISVDNPGTLIEGIEATATITSSGMQMSPADSGTLEYCRTKTITAGASGEITLYSLDDSLRVSSGELLAVIDNDSYDSQVTTLEKKIESANMNLEEYNEDLADCEATAEVAGTVIFVMIEAGDEVNQGTSSMAIYNTDSMEIEADITEIENEYIELGMEVTITKSGSTSDTEFVGTVTEISLEAESSNGVAYFPITITIDSDGALSSGVYVSYTITAAQAEDAVLAPVAAIKNTTAGTCLFIQADSEPENAVDLGEDVDIPDGFYAVVVTTGLTSNNYVEITSGVEEGVTVFEQYVSTGSSTSGSDETSATDEDSSFQMPSDMGGMSGGMGGGMGGGPMG